MDAPSAYASVQSIERLLEHADTGTHDRDPKCCCGQPHCAFLAHNAAALEGLEKDLVSAAEIGQALLVRHESYMAEAEAQRLQMTDTVERLEVEKVGLEELNARTIDENRRLLDQLEELNNQVSASDAQVQSLTASLQSTRAELDRLTMLSQRTALLEEQLTSLELEQSELQTMLVTTEEGKRSALQRWKRAEFTISQLQEQVDRIEKEASEERERHAQVLERMEKRRAVERELEAAAGRLKGAAALTSLGKHDAVAGGTVVSHFVKDILQDNSNLQNGILELRELLLGSNAEVETLREQLQLHRPIGDVEESCETLSEELKVVEPGQESGPLTASNGSSLHVHHHYHAPNITVRKVKKKKPTINTSRYPSSLGSSTPVSGRPRDWYSGAGASISTILEHTSASVPPINHQHRLSAQSTHTMSSFALSSVPSSPRRASSVFDSVDGTFDMSMPTTPESSICSSPMMLPRDFPLMKASQRSVSGPVVTQTTVKAVMPPSTPSTQLAQSHSFDPFTALVKQPSYADTAVSPFGPETIIEEAEQAETEAPDTPKAKTGQPSHLDILARPPLRRAASHESLISISGMDIHTLRSRPSQLLLDTGTLSPRSTLYSNALLSQSPQASTSHAIARGMRPAYQDWGQSGSDLARSLLSSQARGADDRPSLTKKVGGWVWSKWGMAPAPSNGADTADPSLAAVTPKKAVERPLVRFPGVNQPGAIQGLLPPRKAPVQIETRDVNEDLLRESLVEGQGFGFGM